MAPQTSYLLDAIRAVYIDTTDPSKIGKDLPDGLRRKEEGLSKLTHEFLASKITDYEQLEARFAVTIGPKLAKLFLNKATRDDTRMVLPIIVASSFERGLPSSSSSSAPVPSGEIYINTPYYLTTTIYDGNIPFTDFQYEWTVLTQPPTADLEIIEVSNVITPTEWNIISMLNFPVAGIYEIEFKIIHNVFITLVSTNRVKATVGYEPIDIHGDFPNEEDFLEYWNTSDFEYDVGTSSVKAELEIPDPIPPPVLLNNSIVWLDFTTATINNRNVTIHNKGVGSDDFTGKAHQLTKMINGLQTVRFYAQDDQGLLGTYINVVNQLTAFLVVKGSLTLQQNGARILSIKNSAQNNDYDNIASASLLSQNGITPNSYLTKRNSTDLSNCIGTYTQPHIIMLQFNDLYNLISINNTIMSYVVYDQIFNTSTLAIGNRWTNSGWSSSGIEKWDGYLGELVIFNTALVGGDITTVYNYLYNKWMTPPPEPPTLTASIQSKIEPDIADIGSTFKISFTLTNTASKLTIQYGSETKVYSYLPSGTYTFKLELKI